MSEIPLTLLSLSGIGVPPYSARGIKQTLEPIDGAKQLRRTVDGDLRDLSYDQFRKFQSTISCTDQDPPACDGVWPGQVITVDCVQELCYLTSMSMATREAVSGSERTSGDFTFYRPRLEMMVVTFSTEKDEYGADVSWSMQLEEI